MKRILIINPFGIGDVLFTTPSIKSLKENFPESYIGYLCNKRTEPILRTNPDLNEIFVFEKDDYRQLWRESKIKCISRFISFLKRIKVKNFDLSFDLSLGRHYNFFLWLIGIPQRVGFNYKNRGRFLTKKIDIDGYQDKHVVEYYLDLLRFLGLEPKDNRLELFLSQDDTIWAEQFLKDQGISNTDLLIGIIPGGGASWGKDAPIKHWSGEKFAKVADKFIERYSTKIIILGDSTESQICEFVSNSMHHHPVAVSCNTTLRQFASLIGRCKLVITNDGGPLHIATALGTKTISIFGPVDDKVYGPYPPSVNHIVLKKDLPCRPCYRRFKMPKCDRRDCLESITPEEVLGATEKLL